MKYETLCANDNGTVRVLLTIGEDKLEQDFEMDNLEDNIKYGLAIFKRDLEINKPETVSFTPETVTITPSELPEV